MLTWLGMPPLFTRSLARCDKPSRMLLPPVSKKRLTAAGLAAPLVGDIASVISVITKHRVFGGASGDRYEQHRQASATTPMQMACQNHWLREISKNRKQRQSLTAARDIEANGIRKCVLKRQSVVQRPG
nr:hypothetical protein [Tanacetum cinerariifolium]